MCRLLAVKSSAPIDVREPLERFAEISRDSKEYQGHGWGCGLLDADGSWRVYKNIAPIWEDDLEQFAATTLILAHARSAFRDEGIAIENNMPFYDDRRMFIFNGELNGVRIREEGRIGAEKIFNFIKRFDHGDPAEALRRGVDIIARRSRYVRAMNIIMSDGDRVYASTQFSEDPEYFTMHVRGAEDDQTPLVICSDPWPNTTGWTPITGDEVRVYE